MIAYRPVTGRLAQDSGAIPFAKGAVYPVLPVLAVVALVVFLAVAWAQPERGPVARYLPVPDEDAVPSELIVRFQDDVPQDQRAAVLASVGVVADRDLLAQTYVAAAVPDGLENAAGERLARFGAVRSVERDAIRRPAFVPNDEYYQQAQWNLRLIQMEEAWGASWFKGPDGVETCCGDGVVVAVLDTGVAFEDYGDVPSNSEYGQAPDLAASTFQCVDPGSGIEGSCFPWDAYADWKASPASFAATVKKPEPVDTHPNDDYGHGTHVTGTIAQDTGNFLDFAGIAYRAKIMPVKVCGFPDGEVKPTCPDVVIAAGIYWAIKNGASVINLSLGGQSALVEGDVLRDALEDASNADVLVVAAAGNGGDDLVGDPYLDYPAAIESVLAVGATDKDGELASYSSYGQGEGKRMDLLAPGGDKDDSGKGASWISQESYRHFCYYYPADYTIFVPCPQAGTSFAAAHVSGVAALIRAKYPTRKASSVRQLLNCSALDKWGDPDTADYEHGAGLLQAYDALADDDADGSPNCFDDTFNTPTPVPTAVPTPAPTPVTDECTAPAATPAAVPTRAVCGDVDCDGDVDSVDALQVLRHVAGLPSSGGCMGLAYVDCDEDITARDALFILRYTARLPLDLAPVCPPIGYGPDLRPSPPPKIAETR